MEGVHTLCNGTTERSISCERPRADSTVPRQDASMGIVKLLNSWDEEPRCVRAVRSKLGVYYAQYGRFCACHPWEIIVSFVTLTVCILSMSIISGGKVAIPCTVGGGCKDVPPLQLLQDDKPTDGMDAVAMTIVNCVAVVYVYTQFKSLSKTGSKYILGTSGLFVIFSSFIFGIGATFYLMERNMAIISEVVPFFLLLTDLSQATKLAIFAMNSESKAEVQENIGHALALIGPSLALDTLVTALAIGVGVMSGVPKLELICCFGCVTIISNFVVFITFFPASLALALEVCPSNPTSRLDDFARAMQEEKEKKPNPVVQRVKLIMSLGLVAIHLHSHGGFLTKVTGISFGSEFADGGMQDWALGNKMELVPFHQFLWLKLLNLTLGQVVTLALAVALIAKYILFDKPEKPDLRGLKKTRFANGKERGEKKKKKEEEVDFAAPLLHMKTWDQSSALGLYQKAVNGVGYAGSTKPRVEEKLPQGDVPSKDVLLGVTEDVTSAANDTEQLSNAQFTVGSAPVSRRPSVSVALGGCMSDQLEKVSEQLNEALSGATDVEVEEEEEEERREGVRTLDTCSSLLAAGRAGELSDDEVIQLVQTKRLPAYKLESSLDDPERGVSIRRSLLCQDEAVGTSLDELPYSGYDYSKVMGACCENVIGYIPVPVGVAGPLLLDGQQYHVPMATTEGCLVASTNRGCRALASAGGVSSFVVSDGMTRGPVVRLPSAAESTALKLWLDSPENQGFLRECFGRSSRFSQFQSVSVAVAGRLAYIRFKVKTGDAMGMNMISKGAEYTLKSIQEKYFPTMEIVSLSGNFCVDKKPSAINWVEGRGKSVVCEAVVPGNIIKQVLKTEVDALVELNTCKNLVGSAMAGSVGGFNAHAANIVTAIYIATGQDPAQNVGSSNCLTLMEPCGLEGADLRVSCTMPSIEVGTVGGGTFLPAQSACLQLLRVQGAHKEHPGTNATNLARIVCASVLAGELSLMSALAAGHLVKSHMRHNRSRSNLSSIPELPCSRTELQLLQQASLASTEDKQTSATTNCS